MAQDTTPALVLYVGKPDQTYGFDFDKGSFGEIKVAFVRRGLTDYTYDPDTFEVHGFLYAWNGGVYTKTETPDTSTPLYDKDGVATGDTWEATMYREPKNDILSRGYVEWTGEPLTSDDVICIVRETQKDQPYSYPNNQKHIERALDNLSRQIQELQLTADNALKVDPSWNYTMDDERKMDPIAWLQTIVRSKGLTLRELRIDNDYIEYTTDDPDSDAKTWNVIAGVKTGNGGVVSHIRETKILAEDGVTYIPYLEYSIDGGNTWQPASMAGSEAINLCVRKTGDTMTGDLELSNAKIKLNNSSYSSYYLESYASGFLRIGKGATASNDDLFIKTGTTSERSIAFGDADGGKIGSASAKLDKIYAKNLNNGYDIAIPVTAAADTVALKSQVDLAANSGSQLRDKGVWYAKMDAATTPPSSAGVEGRNYADFTQVDGNGDPIIVIYTYTSGAWTQTETIVPPASYNGYLPITSKFWDIQEQAGQQGGLVLWSYSAKTFTPYPRIISTDGIAITNSTFSNGTLTNVITTMPANPIDKTVVNKKYVDDAIVSSGTGRNVSDIFWTMRTDSELNGAVECNGGQYNTTDFTGAQSIGDLLEDGKVPYVSLATYASLLSTRGSCGVFGWDGVGTTAFRVPSLNDIFVETGTAAQIGDYVPAGVPNVKFAICAMDLNKVSGDAVYIDGTSGASYYGGSYTAKPVAKVDLSRASGIYSDTVNTVQPEAIRYRAMVQLFVSATDEAVATCTAITAQVATNTSDVAGLKNASNFTNAGKEAIAGWAMPDYSAGTSLTFTDLNTATEAGFFEIQGEAYNDAQFTIELNGVSKKIAQSNNNYYSTCGFAIIPVSAGDTVKGTSSYNSSGTITFYPCKK